MTRRATIGFDRKLDLEWLDVTAARAAEGGTLDDIRAYLLTYLDSLAFGDQASGSARAKTARVLLRIWGNADPAIKRLHDEGLRILPDVPGSERLPVHWAMTLAAYPFFADHAIAAGKLLSLHDTVSAVQMKRRIAEQWGDRSTVERTSRHVMRTMIDWGVLEDAGKGIYRRGPRMRVNGNVAQLLVEAILLDSVHETITFSNAKKHPALFPFDVQLTTNQLRQSGRIEVHRQGVDVEVLTLRK